ncbi:MAG: transcription-repair coupling factor, partial [Bacteroidetes bacterium]|nr:transcription-repair coupling factor [Bacteroidota bacterium]
LSSGTPVLTVASPYSIVSKVANPETFKKNIIEIHSNHIYDFQKLIDKFYDFNFQKKDFVEGCGDFAVRGGIIDIFPYIGSNPVRFEFFGNTVESIREFDILSQRSIRELQSASIVPDMKAPEDSGNRDVSIFNYLSDDAIIIIHEPEIINTEIEELHKENIPNIFDNKFLNDKIELFKRIVVSPIEKSHYTGESEALNFSSSSQPAFNGSVNKLVERLEQLTLDGYQTYLSCDTKEESERLEELIKEVLRSPNEKLEVRSKKLDENDIEYSNYQLRMTNDEFRMTEFRNPKLVIRNLQSEISNNIEYKIITEPFHSGFIFPPARIAVLTEHEIFGRLKRRSSTGKRRFRGISFKELSQLKRGDYVVHIDHGIGVFSGLQKIKVGGIEQEVIKLQYLDKDTLYVNINYVNRIQKYSSQEGHVPKLHKLGEKDWERTKQRAKKRIKDIARDLIRIYAMRKKEKGFGFSSDSHWQKELEASFMYKDTPDQARTTEEIKRDMENVAPMDRLICGDVGFGKTEVAVRAAFKAVMDNKQVAILVPTTILAQQHYNTFRDRLDRYSVKVECLSRFKTKKEQNKILEDLKSARVDIIIGTHRLLSHDVIFKDIGLLIIDEEHRFGVTAKEKLRMLKTTVDTLTLTATPIPRTLHFSLMGSRDLSLMNTPPQNRLPIITEIIPATDGRQTHWRVIREAILKELHRGGQVFFVHDRVQNISEIVSLIQDHVPESRVRAAHGQMRGHDLENIMNDFLEKKIDVLVATKIIESGLDIPNVNTIVVNRADKFGMAELYQLRGRVGRSNVQAYAYLLTPPLNILPRHSIRRIQAIEEFTELGSGFNLAMRDLEIRGAGNLLGAEQSGYILEMGFETYEKILEQAVHELKDEEFKELFANEKLPSPKIETLVETDIEALIPDFYVEKDYERLEIYRRLYKIENVIEINNIRLELQDRFGEYPPEVENLLQIIGLRITAAQYKIQKVELKGTQLSITLPDKDDLDFYGNKDGADSKLNKLVKKFQSNAKYNPRLSESNGQLELTLLIRDVSSDINRITQSINMLINLFE